ncbi:MAG: DEAD/DEAH box helicase [Treponema sp.]|nr:DEAD/DEAH box helicase [Treponema sp.]
MNEPNSFSMLPEPLLSKLNELNISSPTKVQEKVIPQIIEGKNIIFQSETGTGKTFAYLLPILKKIMELPVPSNASDIFVKAVIAAPTFELASQINQSVKSISGIKTALFLGGAPIKRQLEILKEKPEIVIGTESRLVELIRLKKLKIARIMFAVFDEADRLVKKEMKSETLALMSEIPSGAQIIACTATIDKDTKKFFSDFETEILPEEDVLKRNISHWAIYAEYRDKIDTLRKFLTAENPGKALVFTSRADQVENICSKLRYKKIDCMALHAKADKVQRKAAIDRFRSGKAKILITSDLSARGLDIQNITHVIQMDLPQDRDFFIHRAGRTARAGKTGINVVIGDEYEMRQFALLEKKLGITVYPKEIREGKVVSPEL